MNDIIKIIKLIEDSNVLIDGITETVKHEKKKKKKKKRKKTRRWISCWFGSISSVAKGIQEGGIRRAGRGYIDKDF